MGLFASPLPPASQCCHQECPPSPGSPPGLPSKEQCSPPHPRPCYLSPLSGTWGLLADWGLWEARGSGCPPPQASFYAQAGLSTSRQRSLPSLLSPTGSSCCPQRHRGRPGGQGVGPGEVSPGAGHVARQVCARVGSAEEEAGVGTCVWCGSVGLRTGAWGAGRRTGSGRGRSPAVSTPVPGPRIFALNCGLCGGSWSRWLRRGASGGLRAQS